MAAEAPALLAASEPGLLCLPHGPLQIIWTALRSDQAAQHALRCSCRALRDFSTPLITVARVEIPEVAGDGAEVLPTAVDWVISQLAAFPSKATLSTLKLECAPSGSVEQVVPSFCFGGSPRLAFVTKVCMDMKFMVSTYLQPRSTSNFELQALFTPRCWLCLHRR